MAKMIRCKTCGNSIAKSAKICPHCGAKCNVEIPLVARLLIAFFALIILFNVFVKSGEDGDKNESSSNSTSQQSESASPKINDKDSSSTRNDHIVEQESSEISSTQEDQEPEQTNKGREQLLVDDDFVKVSFIEVFEEPSIEGVFYFRLCVENKTEKTVTIYLEDSSVNKVSTLALSGIPMTIQPGSKSLTPFFFSYKSLDISSIDELEEISFRVNVKNDETFEEIETTDFLTIPF